MIKQCGCWAGTLLGGLDYERGDYIGRIGRRAMDRLKAEGRALNCAKLILDTGLNNALAHRFYYRQGLLATSLRFNTVL